MEEEALDPTGTWTPVSVALTTALVSYQRHFLSGEKKTRSKHVSSVEYIEGEFFL